ncbi:HNH endonuclease signature motif containing protein [Nocardioides daphniae]|uniref:HNH endonuclease n=1 Tax=Nocardioides daphniae TaxID=402297 RepID=A0ABQ1Q764_9ACTN|nr:HNH endonuclease signature motif containing protein [Nocardioides daphniae]GGD17342.1 HNH endonuclease [Nocardioides daphniae]
MHPVNAVAEAISASLKSVCDVNPTFMSADEKAYALLSLLEVESRTAELRLRVMAAAGDVAEREGFRSIATWLAHHGHVRRGDAAADLRLAEALDRERPTLAAGVREGRVTIAQARVIAAAVEELPDRVGRDVIEAAEAKLVELAADHDPSDLAKLGRRILEVVDPDRFEDEEARRLADAEKHASERQRLRMRALGDGTTRITAVVPDATAARLGTYLHAFTNPRLADGAVRTNAAHQEDEKPAFGTRITHPRRMAEAFTQLLETLDPTRLPIHGGDATHVMVTIPFEALKRDLGVATIDNATPGDGFDTITAAQARRLACTARIIPAVLGTHGERRALALRDGTCRAEGCTIPGTWSEAHHLVPWSHDGTTNLDNAALLCSRHHHRAHDTAYDMTRLASGEVRFHRRR